MSNVKQAIKKLSAIQQQEAIQREVLKRELTELLKDVKLQLAYYGEDSQSAMTKQVTAGIKKLSKLQ